MLFSSLYFPLSKKKKKNQWPSNKSGAINTCLNKLTNLVIQYIERCSSTQMFLKTKCNYWYIHERLLLWYILALVSLHMCILLIFNSFWITWVPKWGSFNLMLNVCLLFWGLTVYKCIRKVFEAQYRECILTPIKLYPS